tara:strand:+ start:2502 stop:2942 length:441 start_codon:yes stop_codon:yes gene_type:complete
MADKITPFTFINSINQGRKGKHLLADSKADKSLEIANPDAIDKSYVPFIINRGMSYFKDTILCANEMNQHANLPARMQYDFYRNMLTNKKRFSKWNKKKDTSEDIALIQKEYSYSRQIAEMHYPVFTEEELRKLRKKHNSGGLKRA